MDWRGKTAVVTGSSSGIGREIKYALLDEGVNVIGVDLEDEPSQRPSSREDRGVYIYKNCDVTQAGALKKIFEYHENNPIHILVNNAGITNYKRIIDSSAGEFEKLIDTNILGMTLCTKYAIKNMRNHKSEGHIFYINSLLGHELPPGPPTNIEGVNGWNLYPVTKHATVVLSQSIRREIKESNLAIRVTSICPGLVKGTKIAKKIADKYDFFAEHPSLDPIDIADAVMYALGRRRNVEISELIVNVSPIPRNDDVATLSEKVGNISMDSDSASSECVK